LTGKDLLGLDSADMSSDVADVMLLLRVVEHLLPESAGLLEVKFANSAELVAGIADELLVLGILVRLLLVSQRRDRALIVGTRTLVVVGGGTVALEVGDGDDRCVNGQLLVVHTQTVTVGIGVGEETGLEDGVS